MCKEDTAISMKATTVCVTQKEHSSSSIWDWVQTVLRKFSKIPDAEISPNIVEHLIGKRNVLVINAWTTNVLFNLSHKFLAYKYKLVG